MLRESKTAHEWQSDYLPRDTGVVRTHDNEVRRDVHALRLHIDSRCRDADHGGSNTDTLHV